MNILFTSISSIPDVRLSSISLDLLREFQRHGHNISILCALEKTSPQSTYYSEEEGFKIVRVKIGGNKKANIFEKGMTLIKEPNRYISAIKKYYDNDKFDLIIYPTPPITQVKTIEFIKKRDNAKSYLLLKDIFPQNAVDIGIMNKTGLKSVIYKYFRCIEKKLYSVSDYIGCMSKANVDYLLTHNPDLNPNKVEISPNSIKIIDKRLDKINTNNVRKKYGIPLDKVIFIYGGNLGKPQGIPFLIECMKNVKIINDAFFVIVGDGTEYEKLQQYVEATDQKNIKLIRKLPKEEYDSLVGSCDVGLIFLDYRFTIPNFPSRLLGYLQAGIPVLAATDTCSDIGDVITEGQFGWWCNSDNVDEFISRVVDAINADRHSLGEKGYEYLSHNYSVENQYEIIINNFNKEPY